MAVNKQTVLLVTMLTLMVVLSAYYMMTGPVEPVNQVAVKNSKGNDVEVNIRSMDKPATVAKKAESDVKSGNDYFVGYRMQRGVLRSQMTEEYMKVLTDPEATKEQLKDAQAKIDQLMKADKRETVLEELICKEGFKDVVVMTNDSRADVVVQSPELSRQQAVKLIQLVNQQMDISPLDVSVAYRP